MTRRQKQTLWSLIVIALAAIIVVIAVTGARNKNQLRTLDSSAGEGELDHIYERHDAGEDAEAPEDVAENTSARTIRGSVVRPNGEPAAGVRVIARTPGSGETFEVETTVGGMFEFGEMPTDLYAVEATAEGFGPAIAIGVVPGGAPLRLVLESGRDLRGVVLRDDEPVPFAVLHLGSPGMFPQRSAVTDEAGRFAISGLRVGTYEYAVTGDGVGTGFGGRLTIGEESAPVALEIEADPAPNTRIRVVDRATSEPIVAGVVTISEAQLHVLSITSLVEAGQTEINYLPIGEYQISVRAPGYMPHNGRFWVQGDGEAIWIGLSRGASVSGRVIDEAGNGVPGVRMSAVVETDEGARWEIERAVFQSFHRLVRPDGSPYWWPVSSYSSSDDGSFSISGIPAGQAVVLGRREGFATAASPPLILSADQNYENLRLVLHRGRAIRGRVEDGGGAAVAGATVVMSDPALPAWLGSKTMLTDRLGVFVFENAGPRARLTARHQEHGATELDVEVPPEGLDDLIVRLSNEQRPGLSGRVFTTQAGPAAGAAVWAMQGSSDVAVCRGHVESQGWFHLTNCSAVPESIIASLDGYAPLIADLGGDLEPRDWVLRAGGEIDVVSQGQPMNVAIRPRMVLPESLWAYPSLSLERWSREVVPHVAPGTYSVVCEAEGFAPATLEVEVRENRRVEALCPTRSRMMDFDVYVIDNMGAPVAGALLMIDGTDPPFRGVTGEAGSVRVRAEPGAWASAVAVHERWGQGRLDLQVPYEAAEPFRVRLVDPVGGADTDAFMEQLDDWGITAALDSRSVVIDEITNDSPAFGVGLRRRDLVMWAKPTSDRRLSVGVRRNGDIVDFELVRPEQPR